MKERGNVRKWKSKRCRVTHLKRRYVKCCLLYTIFKLFPLYFTSILHCYIFHFYCLFFTLLSRALAWIQSSKWVYVVFVIHFLWELYMWFNLWSNSRSWCALKWMVSWGHLAIILEMIIRKLGFQRLKRLII